MVPWAHLTDDGAENDKLRFAGLVFMAGLLPVCALPGVSRWLKFAG